MNNDNCLFCKIIKGDIPSSKIYENDQVYAFLDINPVNKGHTLVIPKNHSSDMLDDDDEDLKACIHAAKIVGKAVMNATNAQGFNFSSNIKKAAGQVVFHTHFHIIPRFDGDGFEHWKGKAYENDEMNQFKNKIINELEK